MRTIHSITIGCAFLFCALPAGAHESGPAKPTVLLDQIVEGMPAGAEQEIRVMTATFAPQQRTVFHTHRFPVTVHVLDGEFVLDIEGRETVRHKTGETFVEPPNAKMTGFNGSADHSLDVIIFYVSDPGVPFLDPLK